MLDPLDKSVTAALNAWRMQLDAGISLQDALEHCALMCRGEPGKLFSAAAALTAKGEGIRHVLEPLAPALSEGERATLAAGWNAGRMEQVLDLVIKQREAWYIARQHIISRCTMPLVQVFGAAFLAPLPGMIVGQYGLIVYCILVALPITFFSALIAGGFAAFRMRSRAALTASLTGASLSATPLDRILLQIPFLRHAEQQSNLAEFGTLLGNLLGAGAPILEGLGICSRSLSNGCYRDAMLRIQNGVGKGDSLGLMLKEESETLFPNEFVSAIAVGEKSGALDAALTRAAAVAREAYMRFIERLAEIIPRVIYGLVVLFIVISILNIFINVYLKTFDDALKAIPCL